MMRRKMPAVRSFAGQQRRDLDLAAIVQHFRQKQAAEGFGGPSNSYSESPPVFACVKAKADAMGGLPLMVSTADDRIVETGPLADLCERPNAKMPGRQFRRFSSAYLDLFGVCYWWLNMDSAGRPLEVIPLNPARMEAKRDRRTGELLGWWYHPAGRYSGERVPIPVEEIHQIIDPDFEGDGDLFEGLSPRKAVAHAISQYYKADRANEASLDNSFEPGGILSHTTGPINEDQRNSLREELIERHAGAGNRRRPLLLYGDWKYDQVQVNFADMEFAELKKMSRTDICAAFGVPPAVIGYYEDSNYAHADAAEQGFWIKTIMPRAAWLAEEFTLAVLDRFNGDRSLRMADARCAAIREDQAVSYGYRRAARANARAQRRYYAWFDDSGVPAVQKARLANVDAASKWNAIGVPVADIIEATDAPFPVRDWQRTWFKPFGLIDVQEDTSIPGFDDPSGADETDPLEEPSKGRQRGVDLPSIEQRDERSRARLWQQWRASWGALERAMRAKVSRHFNGLRKQTLERLAAAMPQGAKGITPDQRRDLIGDILFDVIKANEGLLKVIGPILRESYRLGGEQVMTEAADYSGQDEPQPFDIADPQVSAALRRRQIGMAKINKTLQKRIRETLSAGLDGGKTINELKDELREKFNIAGKRAGTIARTEVGAAVEESRSLARVKANVPLKSWLSSRKETGRPGHAEAERRTMSDPIQNGEPFEIANHDTGQVFQCDHPRDSSLPPGESINCGCTSISRYPDDTARSALARYMRRGFLTYEAMLKRDAAAKVGEMGAA